MTVQHGTYAGYKWHYRRKVAYCDPCRAAQAEYARLLYAKQYEEHGSSRGLRWHTLTRTPVCDLCLYYAIKAELEAARAYRAGDQ